MRTCELTKSEVVILQSLISGKTNSEIASEKNLSPYTVKTHLSHIYIKLNVRNRMQAVVIGLQRGIIK